MDIEQIAQEALQKIAEARDKSTEALEELATHYLGRKGVITGFLRNISSLPEDVRPKAGQRINEIKVKLAEAIDSAKEALTQKVDAADALDVTLPGRPQNMGTLHPITQVNMQIADIFLKMGYSVAKGPEVELDFYNFEALNFPKDHPARDMQDTFFISDNVLLRTHTSGMQIRTMMNQEPPVRIIAPGRVFRCDSDITHTPMFHQVEGLLVDKGISFGDLKGTLVAFLQQMFGADKAVRFRPSFFPFTEPSAEVDIECVMCGGAGCRICKGSGWLEILGCGMVHPNVLTNVGYDPKVYTGFAFGMGVERIAMLKYGIDDLRKFFENDLKFLRQF